MWITLCDNKIKVKRDQVDEILAISKKCIGSQFIGKISNNWFILIIILCATLNIA